MSTKTDNTAATAGRGFLVITAAKLWFMVGGALINFGLPFIFSSAWIYGPGSDGSALFGQFVDINNTLSILSMVMVTGVMQSVSKFVSEAPEQAGGVVRQARNLMIILGILIGGGFALASPWLAESRNNPELVNGYRAAGLVLACYAVYTVFIGTLNGRKQFLPQALFDISFTSIKVVLVMGLALLGLGVVGAFAGFGMAALIIMFIAAWKVGKSLGEGPNTSRLYAYAAQVMLYTLVFNLVFKLDVVMLKPAAAALLVHLGAGVGDALSKATDSLVGVYGMAVNIARLPWQATIAITFVVFPLVSEATFSQDKERTRLYIQQTLRYAVLLSGAAAVVLTAVPHAFSGLLPARFAEVGAALSWLAPAYFFFSLFNLVNTILMSAGRATAALLIGASTVGLVAALYQWVLPMASSTAGLLELTGACTLGAFGFGLALGLGVLWKAYGAPVPLGTLGRVGLLSAVLVAVGRLVPVSGRVLPLALAAVVGLAFLVGLVALKEFGEEDKARLSRVLRRKKA